MEGIGTKRVTKHFGYVVSLGIVNIVYVGGSCYINMLFISHIIL